MNLVDRTTKRVLQLHSWDNTLCHTLFSSTCMLIVEVIVALYTGAGHPWIINE